MFDIQFIREKPELQDGGVPALRGRIVLGEFSEQFLASLHVWNREDYEAHWLSAAEELLRGENHKAAMISSAFQFVWMFWREGERIYVRQNLLGYETGSESWFDPKPPFSKLPSGIPDRLMDRDAETPPSEWEVPTSGMRDFLSRQRSFCSRCG